MANKGGNVRNGMGMRLWRMSVGMRGICVGIENMGNQGGDAGNEGGNLSIAVEIT